MSKEAIRESGGGEGPWAVALLGGPALAFGSGACFAVLISLISSTSEVLDGLLHGTDYGQEVWDVVPLTGVLLSLFAGLAFTVKKGR